MTETEIDHLRREVWYLADTLAQTAYYLGAQWSGRLDHMSADCKNVLHAAQSRHKAEAFEADKASREAAVRPAEVHSPAPTGVSEGDRVGKTSTEAVGAGGWRSMSSAPRDGTVIVGRWLMEGWGLPGPDSDSFGPVDHPSNRIHWDTEKGDWVEDDGDLVEIPMAWRPLPEPVAARVPRVWQAGDDEPWQDKPTAVNDRRGDRWVPDGPAPYDWRRPRDGAVATWWQLTKPDLGRCVAPLTEVVEG